jgi:DNA polymerase III sliding clamp (beta) subunit (PCNA family)
MKKSTLTQDKAKNSPAGGVLVGKKDGQTIIYDDGKVGGWFVGKTHKEGGIQGINKSTGQPIEVQSGEVIITAPALADQTKNEFNGKMMTNREVLSKINVDAGGVAFADGGEVPKKIKRTGASYNYGGKTMTDHEIYKYITGGGIAEDFSIRDIANIHQVPLSELKEELRIGMIAESEHKADKKEQMEIVKDHLLENPKYYTLLKKAGLVEEKTAPLEKSKWLKQFYVTNNPSIDKLLKDLQPKIEELIEKQKELVLKNTEKQFGEPRPMSELDIQFYEAGLIFKMVQAFNKYLKNTDELYDVSIDKRGELFEVNGKVKRDGRTYKFDTELIGAGGYNIQEYHYRYIIKTDLPDSNENSAVENIKAKMGTLKKIKTIDEDIERYLNNISQDEKALTQGFSEFKIQGVVHTRNLSDFDIKHNKKRIQDFNKEIEKLEGKKADLISVFHSLDKKGVGVNFGKQVKEAIGRRILVDRLQGSKYKETGNTLDFKIESRLAKGGKINTFSFTDEGNGLCTMKAGLELRGKYTPYAEYKNLQIKEIPYKINEIFNGEFSKYLEYKKGGEVESLVRDAKSGNTPARDLNNYNDVLDLEADGMVGADTGLYKDGGELKQKGFINEELDQDLKEIYQNRAYKNISGSDFYFSRLNVYPLQNVFTIELSDGTEIGRATLNEKENYLTNIRLDENYRRKGLASNLYDYIEYVIGKKLKPSPDKISKEAQSLWIKRNPNITFAKGGLIAPNGEKSNLTPEQYKLVRTPEFKEWFGDWEKDPENASKVVDENGEPLVVYHGTNSDFNEFDTNKQLKGWLGKGFYFTKNKIEAKGYGKKLLKCFLNIRNPFVVEGDKVNPDGTVSWSVGREGEISKKYGSVNADDISTTLKHFKNDGIMEGDMISCFYPTQIKLADGTNTTFDSMNPDIRYATGGMFNTEPFLNYYFDEIAEFLKYQNNITLNKDFTFKYKGELFRVEPIVLSEKNIKEAYFSIIDSDDEQVGDIVFNPNNNKKFEANSDFFDWNNIKFYDGGDVKPYDANMEGDSADMMFAEGGAVSSVVTNWNQVPSIWKDTSKIKKVAFTNSPYDKGLYSIVAPFLGKDDLRPIMTGINFDENGITVTNAHVLISLPYPSKEFEGVYEADLSKRANPEQITIEGTYPNYSAIIPKKEVTKPFFIDVYKLLQYTNVALKFANKYTYAVNYKIEDEIVGFNGRFLVENLKTLLKLGHETAYAHFIAPNKAVLLTPNEDYEIGNDELILTMPVMVRNATYGVKDIDYNKELSVYYDFNDNEIHNADGSIAEFKMKYEDNSSISKEDVNLLQKLANGKNILSILDYVKVENGVARASDLDSEYYLSGIDLPDGIYKPNNGALEITMEAMEDYPRSPIFVADEDTIQFVISSDILEYYIDKFQNVVGKDDLRPVLKGICLHHTSDNKLFLAGTDANILLKVNITEYVDMPVYNKDMKFIIQPKRLYDFLNSTENTALTIKSNVVATIIESDNWSFYARNIDGNYVNYDAVMPRETNKLAVVNLEPIKKAFSGELVKNYVKESDKSQDVFIFNNEDEIFIGTSGKRYASNPYYVTKVEKICDTNVDFSIKDYYNNGQSVLLLMPYGYDKQTNFSFRKDLIDRVFKIVNSNKLDLHYTEMNRAYLIPIDSIEYKTTTKEHKVREQKPSVAEVKLVSTINEVNEIKEAIETLEMLSETATRKDKKEIKEAIEVLQMLLDTYEY